MKRREFLQYMTAGTAAASTASWALGSARSTVAKEGEGRVVMGLYPANIVPMKDGSLITDSWMHSTDGGVTWAKVKPLFSKPIMGLIRLPNRELGCWYAEGESMAAALGNSPEDWYFCSSADEGQNWSSPVKITLPGVTMGLQGTMFALRSGRLILATYSQFLVREALWGKSWGTYKGVRFATESEGHFAEMEATRVYYSDDNGRSWKANDGWIIGWHDKKWTDSFVEANGVELADGRLMLIGRSLTGRLYQAFSSDQGATWTYATPTELVSSDSPGRLAKFPGSNDLLLVWNEISREENRRGFRRSRLESAVSKDSGATWEHFKTLEHGGLPAVGRIPPEPDMSPNWGADDVGALPDDFAVFHYPAINFLGDDVYVSYGAYRFEIGKDAEGLPVVKAVPVPRTRILPTQWFYT